MEKRQLAHAGPGYVHVCGLRRHADDERIVEEVVAARLVVARKIEAAMLCADTVLMLMPGRHFAPTVSGTPIEVRIVERRHGVDRKPSERDRGQRQHEL